MAAAKSEVFRELYKILNLLDCPYLSSTGEEVENLKELLTDANSRYDFLKWMFTRLDVRLAESLENLQNDLKTTSFSKIFANLGLGRIEDVRINKILLLMSYCANQNSTNYIGSIEDVKYEVEGDWDCSDFKSCDGFIPKNIKMEISKFKNLRQKEPEKPELEVRLLNLEEKHNSTASLLQELSEINLATSSDLLSFHESINQLSKSLQIYKKIHEFNFDPVLTNSDTNSTNLKSLNSNLLLSCLTQIKTMVQDLNQTNERFAEICHAFNKLQAFAKENNLA